MLFFLNGCSNPFQIYCYIMQCEKGDSNSWDPIRFLKTSIWLMMHHVVFRHGPLPTGDRSPPQVPPDRRPTRGHYQNYRIIKPIENQAHQETERELKVFLRDSRLSKIFSPWCFQDDAQYGWWDSMLHFVLRILREQMPWLQNCCLLYWCATYQPIQRFA